MQTIIDDELTNHLNVIDVMPSSSDLDLATQSSERELHIITYNAQSLMSDVRLDLLLTELSDISWDVVVITETWREATREYFVLACGHSFYGSGGTRGACGVGVLVNKRWASHNFTAINERLCLLDLVLQLYELRIIGMYMPQVSCPDEKVEEIY